MTDITLNELLTEQRLLQERLAVITELIDSFARSLRPPPGAQYGGPPRKRGKPSGQLREACLEAIQAFAGEPFARDDVFDWIKNNRPSIPLPDREKVGGTLVSLAHSRLIAQAGKRSRQYLYREGRRLAQETVADRYAQFRAALRSTSQAA
jgi:hypothetical protein